MTREQWREERNRFWKRVNIGFNALMIVVITLFVLRNCVAPAL